MLILVWSILKEFDTKQNLITCKLCVKSKKLTRPQRIVKSIWALSISKLLKPFTLCFNIVCIFVAVHGLNIMNFSLEIKYRVGCYGIYVILNG